ncbi:MAG: hypothetical protein AB1546_03540 [bacterium]
MCKLKSLRCSFMTFCLLTMLLLSAATAAEKDEHNFAVALYHFNLQYVAGNKEVEDRIVTESLDPLLDLYLAHPAWGADFEMQCYMVEQVAQRFPSVLEKLKTLIDRKQIELVSFHYADQLFLAYPRWDMDWSQRLCRRVLAEADIVRSGVVFTQEGQFGEGMLNFMANNGFDTALLPKNLYRYFHKDYKSDKPFYKMHNVNVILSGASVSYDDKKVKINLHWTYSGDAELLPTQNVTPYSPEFKFRPEAMKKYEDQLASLEKSGVKIVTVSTYIEALQKLKIAPSELKPVLDGTWQPNDTDNVFRWMGDHRAQHERDAEVLTNNIKARNRLNAAEAAVVFLKNKGKASEKIEDLVFNAWRDMMLAEVSDSTGWTPLPEEVKYSQQLAKQVMSATEEIFKEVKSVLKADYISIDPKKGTVTALTKQEKAPEYPKAACPITPQLKGDFADKETQCYKVSGNRWNMTVVFTAKNWYSNDVVLVFPRKINSIVYSPALTDDVVISYPQDKFEPELNTFYLPAPNGLIGLEENLFLIKHTETVHVAYEYSLKEKTIALRMLHPPNGKYEWRLSIVKGSKDDALKEANLINTYAPLTF